MSIGLDIVLPSAMQVNLIVRYGPSPMPSSYVV